MSSPTPQPDAAPAPNVRYTQEIRFAVVMYGGSSLAIYINGVAQELLRLVRATAPLPEAGGVARRAYLSDEELSGTERVYRKLGQILVRGKEARGSRAGENSDIRTRFVIDILTGTSAGGINAVYLAKALANDQSLDELKRLWITQGDIKQLLNDKRWDESGKLGRAEAPGSLLNSRRMYWELLDALRGMDRKKPSDAKRPSPYVEELDLFVTATDMNGRVLRLRLADDVVTERRHRNVFRFRYATDEAGGKERNDFTAEHNPFLAFAARCTSAHPAAFEPVRYADVEPVLKAKPPAPPLPPEYGTRDKELEKFYEDYLLTKDEEERGQFVPFRERVFNDGGVLDNSPFSFASDTLPFRHADVPVDRKLLYIEPTPEHPESESAAKPDFVDNALSSLVSLPRYQTIVDDIVRVLERNRLIGRVGNIVHGMEEDLQFYREVREEPPSRADFLAYDKERLRVWMRQKGTSWGSYQRLRVAEVTDDLALLVARAAGFDEESDEFLAVRHLVRRWRAENYHPHMQGRRKSEIEFLLRFDLMWLMRRVRFVLTKASEFSCLDKRAAELVRFAQRKEIRPQPLPGGEDGEEFRDELLRGKRGGAAAFNNLRAERERLWARGAANPFAGLISKLEITSQDLVTLLKQPTAGDRQNFAKELLDGGLASPTGELKTRRDVLMKLAVEVAREIEDVYTKVGGECSKAMAPPREDTALTPPRHLARQVLWPYYKYFEDYDLISYPILYSTHVGEELDTVEVFRISPADATSLIDEKETNLRHLAGTTLGSFGAFFEEEFRRNDMLWGRLDGAERLIHALLPGDAHAALRDELTAEAHRAIIIEETLERDLKPGDSARLRQLLKEELASLEAPDDGGAMADALAARLEGSGVNDSLKGFLRSFLRRVDPREKFVQDFKDSYERKRKFTPQQTLESAARASRIFGRMLEGYAAAHRRKENKVILWAARLTQWTWGLVIVALPGTIPNMLLRYWLKLLYMFELLLIAGGLLLATEEIQQLGIIALVLTAVLHIVLFLVGDYVRSGKPPWIKSARLRVFLRVLGLAAVVGVGLWLLFSLRRYAWLPVLDYLIRFLEDVRNAAAGP